MDYAYLQKVYDGFAESYDENREQFDIDELIRSFYQRLKNNHGELLDLGCGAGIPLARFFVERNWSVTGVDFSRKMLNLASKHVPQMKTVFADITHVGFADNAFDAITAIYSLFHIPKDQHHDLFKKIYTWLKPGGKAFFTYATKEYTGNDVFDGYKEFLGQRLYYSHDTLPALNRMLRKVGFEIEAKEYKTIAEETFLWVTIRK